MFLIKFYNKITVWEDVMKQPNQVIVLKDA